MSSAEGAGDKTNWAVRRRFMFAVAAFYIALPTYIIVSGIETRPAEAATTMCLGGLASVIAFYVMGAVWDDKGKAI